MRDKYIELIKEYIKEKPEYKLTLNELKADVLTVGATEEEFDEAIRQVTGLSDSSKLILDQPETDSFLGNILKFTQSAKFHLWARKKYVAVVAFSIILIVIISQIRLGDNAKNKEELSVTTPLVKTQAQNKGAIPVVYANQKSVDPEKIFSIKSSSVQLTITGIPKKEVLGFFPYWMLLKQDKINLSTLTSVSLFGLEVDGEGNIVTRDQGNEALGGWTMWKDPLLDEFIQRARNQNLKIYLTLKAFNSSNIESLTKSDAAQKNLIANALYFVNSKNLDGINIDFEYVGDPPQETRDGFTRLITNLNAELKRQVPQSYLTIDTYLVSGSDKGIFNMPLLAQNSDAFVIMGYDMHTPLGAPGPVSAMGGDTNIVGYVQNYLEKVDASKLILAVPYYGYDWPNVSASSSADLVSILPYAEIAEQSKNVQLSWDETSQTPFFTYKNAGIERIVHFDNVRSLGIKYDFINRKNLKGVGIWALGYDGQNQDLEKLLIDKFINQ